MFLVFEGIDGCGKTTQIKLVKKWLKSRGLKVFLTDEPWKKGLRDLIKKKLIGRKSKWNYPVVDALLFAADRIIHINEEIIPALRKYDVVICDRYYHSSLAYQSAQGLDLRWIKEINKFALKPDLTIIFDVPAKVAIRRIMKTRNSRDKYEVPKFLEKTRKQYLKLPKFLKNERIVVVDGTKKKEEVFEEVKKEISKFI